QKSQLPGSPTGSGRSRMFLNKRIPRCLASTTFSGTPSIVVSGCGSPRLGPGPPVPGAVAEIHDEVVRRAKVRAMIERVHFGVHSEAEAAGYNKMTSIIAIQLKDGRTLRGREDFAKSSPANPMSYAEVSQLRRLRPVREVARAESQGDCGDREP